MTYTIIPDVAHLDHPRADVSTIVNVIVDGVTPGSSIRSVGVAYCSKRDEYTLYGLKLAFARAVAGFRPDIRKALWAEFAKRFPAALQSREQKEQC